MTHWSLKCNHMYIYHKCLIFSYWSGKYSSNQEKKIFYSKKILQIICIYVCIYEKFCCVICNTIVNEECKYILNHNSDKFMYSLSYTPQKLKKKNIGTKFVHRICTTDIPNRDLLFLVVKPVFRLSFWPQIFQGNHRGQRLNLNNSSLKEWSHNKSSFHEMLHTSYVTLHVRNSSITDISRANQKTFEQKRTKR